MVAACGRPAGDDALARMRARGTLRWGGDVQGGEPYVFQDPAAGRLVGFEVEIADALARRLGVRAEFVQNDWQTLIPSLERGDFDLALNGIEVTAARRARAAGGGRGRARAPPRRRGARRRAGGGRRAGGAPGAAAGGGRGGAGGRGERGAGGGRGGAGRVAGGAAARRRAPRQAPSLAG